MERSEVLDILRKLLADSEIPWQEVREGLALVFTDGCDMLLVDDRAIAKSRKKTAAAVASEFLKTFQKLDKRRTAVLLGLRHWVAETGYAIQRSATGNWEMEKHGGTAILDVGHHLTSLIRKQGAETGLGQLLKYGCFDQPTTADLRRLVAYKTPPQNERPIQEDPQEYAAHVQATLRMRTDDELREVRTTYRRKNSEYDLAERLRERLGYERVNIGCCLPKDAIQIDFSDGEGFYALHSSPSHVKKLIAKHGSIDAVVDDIVARFTRIDQARSQTLHALESLLAKRGCYKDGTRWNRDEWCYGTTHQQYALDPGVPLTRKLNRRSPAEFILKWCEENQVTPDVTLQEVESVLSAPAVEIPLRMLPPVSFAEGPQIPPLEAWDLNVVDQVARLWIETFRAEAEQPEAKQRFFSTGTLYYWNDPQWFVRGTDTWVDDAWWIERAGVAWEAAEQRRKPYIASQQSATILLAYRDNRPRERVIKRYQKLGYYHPEAIEDGLAWLLEGELPWSLFDYEDIDFPLQLGKVPPQQARRIAAELREAIKNNPDGLDNVDDFYALRNFAQLDRVSAEEWLAPSEIEQVHQWCLRWASATDDLMQFCETYPLQIATTFAWADVADQIEQNPITPTSVLYGEEGRWYLNDFLLWLSRLSPGPFTARWAAYVLSLNREVVPRGWKFANARGLYVGVEKDSFQNQTKPNLSTQREQKLAAAIAWHRCREAGTIG
ncbi:hypothetical protein [Blastopirellula marina]|uniref:Uncharacterized protein n=1 Tax=Blastopirellula marina TaxID=124 RepID=A0A2S8F7W2_9BACT|nr:hypothetical protein [Blastopirellula marina]PQO28251.1 hypothetical protein C5Y98_25480 [Blastopirellula marina]PTL41791.1 hypothetical protein C5Y97_25495 [Blastopirellula marina]